MIKMRLPRKVLDAQEAKQKIVVERQRISVLIEEILYWTARLNKSLSKIDMFIICSDKTINNPQEIIDRNRMQIAEIEYKIENYYNKFIK